MTEEPDIIKELRAAEKIGVFQSKKVAYEKLEGTEKASKGVSDDHLVSAGSNIGWDTEDVLLGNLEDKYRIIFENSAVAITLTNENEKIISWNKYAEELLGRDREDLFMMPVESLYPVEEWRKIRSENVRRKGMQHHLETRILRKDGNLLDVDVSLSVLKDREGNVVGSIGVIQDISDRKDVERKLMFEHDLLQSLLDNIPDSIYFKDTESRFIKVNEAKALHSNVSKEEMVGKTDFDIFSKKDAQRSHEDDLRVMKTGKPIVNKIERITDLDGVDRWDSVTKIPWFGKERRIVGTIGISRDITKRVKGTKETEKYKKVAIGQNLRMIELRDKVKDLISEMEK